MNDVIRFTFGNQAISLHRVLSVPVDGPLPIRLYAKLEEYRRRLNGQKMSTHRLTRTRFKIWVLHELLASKHLDFEEMKTILLKHNNEDGGQTTLSVMYLALAWKVVENYCLNEGAENVGGTGLPEYFEGLEATILTTALPDSAPPRVPHLQMRPFVPAAVPLNPDLTPA